MTRCSLDDYIARSGGEAAFTAAELTAASNALQRLKTSGLTRKLIAFYPFLGRSAQPGRQNLLSDQYPLTLHYDHVWSSSGMRGDGFGAWADTGFTPSTDWPANESGVRQGSFFIDILQGSDNTDWVRNSAWEQFGAGAAGSTQCTLRLYKDTPEVDFPGWFRGGAGTFQFTAPTSYVGTWIATWYNDPPSNPNALTHPDVSRFLYQDGTIIYSDTGGWYIDSLVKDGTLKLGFDNGIRGDNTFTSNRPASCAGIGYGLFPQDVAALRAIIALFRVERMGVLPTSVWGITGDSISQGFTSPFIHAQGNALNYLTKFPPFSDLTTQNLAGFCYGGATAENILAGYATNAHTLAGIASKLFVSCGTNDTAASHGPEVIHGRLRAIWSLARQDGMSPVALTVMKRSDWPQGSPMDIARMALNNLIKADDGTWVDQVIDVDHAIDYADVTEANYGDVASFGPGSPLIHLNEAGHDRVWSYVAKTLR